MKFGLKELLVIVLVCSALNFLDGELFYLNNIRGENIRYALANFRETISILHFNEFFAPVGLISTFMSAAIYNSFQETGVFVAYISLLIIGGVIYLRALEKISSNSVLTLILAGLGTLGVTTGIKDFSIALSFFLSAIEIYFLLTPRLSARAFGIFLCLLHIGVDSSFALAPIFVVLFTTIKSEISLFQLSLFRELKLKLLLASLILAASGYNIQRDSTSPYATMIPIIAVCLALLLAITSRSKKFTLLAFVLLTSGGINIWEQIFHQRFTALAFYAPVVAAAAWELSSSQSKNKLTEAFEKLKLNNLSFLKPSNRLAAYWLLLSFVFFQLATKINHPLNEAYLPTEAMDYFTETRRESPPLHPQEIGGYVAHRLAPVFKRNTNLNYIDLSAQSILTNKLQSEFRDIWNGGNNPLFEKLAANAVLCRGKDILCKELQTKAEWKITSHSTITEKILQMLNKLPEDKKAIVVKKLADESWYLLERS